MWCNYTDISTCEHFAELELVGFERQLVNWLTSVLSGLCPCSTAGNGAQTSRRPLLSTSKSSYIHFMLAFILYYYSYYSYYYYYYYYQFLIFTIIITIIIMTDPVFINFFLLTQSSAWAPIFLIFCPYYYNINYWYLFQGH